jgi:hypothetical protein
MARVRGQARKGERLRALVPHGHWKTTTLVAGLRLDGIAAHGPRRPDQPINRSTGMPSRPMSTRCSCRNCGPVTSSSWTICRATRDRRYRRAIEAVRARLLYLPPYSPDFNPIENAFSKLKALLRKAAERSVEALWQAIERIIDLFTPTKCATSSRPQDTSQINPTTL